MDGASHYTIDRRIKAMNPEERIEELKEKQSEYILNESVLPDPCSYQELAEAQDIALAQWNNTDDGKELIALQHLNGNEQAAELYYALKSVINITENLSTQATKEFAMWTIRTIIENLEKED